MKALSVRQPWAWAILHAGKDVENRDWGRCPGWRAFRGRVLLHASAGCTAREYQDAREFIEDREVLDGGPAECRVPPLVELPRGAIVGAMTITDCVHEDSDFDSPWFCGPYGLLLEDVVELAKPIRCKGALGFFSVPAEVDAEIRRRFG